MANKKWLEVPPKIRVWRYLPLLVIMGLAVHLLVPQITTLERSWSVIRQLAWWAVALAVLAQGFSYLGSAYMLRAILDINRERLSILRGVLITLASSSVGLVAGGWVGGAAATYSWIRRENRDTNVAALAGTLPAILNNAVLIGVALTGTLHLLVVHDLTSTQLIEFGAVLLVLGLSAAGVIATLRYPGPATRLITRAAGRWAALRHKPLEPKQTAASIGGFIQAWRSLGNGRWLHPVLGAVANVGFDMLTLYFLFLAAGQTVTLGVLFAGYGLPFILGKLAFMFPGGVGVIEASMVAFYTSLNVPNPVSVVVILVYRAISFWLPSLLGFAAAAYLESDLSGGSFHSSRMSESPK